MKHLLVIIACIWAVNCTAQVKKNEIPIKTVERIYKKYLKSGEHCGESEKTKQEMRSALLALQKSNKIEDIPLLIEVVLDYDVIDFFAMELIEPIFFQHKAETIKAIDNRIKNKRKWEQANVLPFSNLYDLRRRLEQ